MKEIDPKETPRAVAYELWMESPMPMVTVVKSFDVSNVLKHAHRNHLKFNMLMCYCIAKAAKEIPEFYLLPHEDKMLQYDTLSVNVIVNNARSGINSCDILYNDDLRLFNADYEQLTRKVAETCESVFLEESMVIGTSAIIETEIDAVMNQYTKRFANPMLFWGRYRKGLFRTTLPLSFQFHHVQMDGGHAAKYLQRLQAVMRTL